MLFDAGYTHVFRGIAREWQCFDSAFASPTVCSQKGAAANQSNSWVQLFLMGMVLPAPIRTDEPLRKAPPTKRLMSQLSVAIPLLGHSAGGSPEGGDHLAWPCPKQRYSFKSQL